MRRKKVLKISLILFLIMALILLICNTLINSFAEGKTFTDLSDIPSNKVGLLLGTSKKIKNGNPNPYYTYRIAAAVTLYKENKINFILVSGDNGSIYYNEPNTMKKDLITAGIPSEKIFLDYAGFRTLDSVVRAKEVFGLKNVTIISQKFHNERAIYIAEKKGLHAIGYNAKDISIKSGLRVQLREYFARVKVFLDLAFKTEPRFYGDKISIE
ncbi:vancomycin high temperature exclusion protein [Maribacter sp. 2210JD10-5]|uniref:SanA/YdcF family protein n=1 Tax=Maribacter sp. 2210JD10-5 TaxID=3386272 RepID=UPI0039BCB79D